MSTAACTLSVSQFLHLILILGELFELMLSKITVRDETVPDVK